MWDRVPSNHDAPAILDGVARRTSGVGAGAGLTIAGTREDRRRGAAPVGRQGGAGGSQGCGGGEAWGSLSDMRDGMRERVSLDPGVGLDPESDSESGFPRPC